MRHTISTRALTEEESDRIRRSHFSLWERFGAVMLPILPAGVMAVLWILLCMAVLGVMKLLSIEPPEGVGATVTIGILVVGVASWIYFFIKFARDRARRRKGMKQKRVEVVEVREARVVRRADHSDEDPVYYFGIGENTVLVLQGQWITDERIFGLPPREFDENDELTGEDPFPVSDFTVHRLAASGDVLKIELNGPRLRPEGMISNATKLPPWFSKALSQDALQDSFLVQGEFAELSERVAPSENQ